MAWNYPDMPPSYDASSQCEVLKARRVTAAPLATYHPGALQGGLTSAKSSHEFIGSSPSLGLVADDDNTLARVSAASEGNAAQFIWYELPKHLKKQWAQRDIRAVLDECPRYTLASGGNRFVRLYSDIVKGALTFDDWFRESVEMTFLVDMNAGDDAVSACQGARDRIRFARDDDAANFIWMELPKVRKAEWDARLIRSVLDNCHTYSAAAGCNRFVKLYDDIVNGSLSASSWLQQSEESLASLQLEQSRLFDDFEMAQMMHHDLEGAPEYTEGGFRRCKAAGCILNHVRHFCKNCKDRNSDHCSRNCPAAPQTLPALLPTHFVGGCADAQPSLSAAVKPGSALLGPSNEMTLFHQTSPANAQKIVLEQVFKCSDPAMGKLLAGPGIYFAASAEDTTHKVRDPANKGCILSATVDLGTILDIDFNGDSSITRESLKSQGFDSVRIRRNGNPGTEYVVYSTSQIRNIRIYQHC